MIPAEPDFSELSPPAYYPRLAWEGVDGITVPKRTLRPFEEGSGTESDPYVIRTRGDLVDLHRASIYWDKHFILGNDVDMSLGGPPPIGICAGSSFSGTFDGNGHVIRNLHWSPDDGTTPMWNGGLFGYVTGEVRNVTLENCEITGGVNSRRIGLLAGSNYGVIKNCSVTGSITVGEYSQFIGGLIGASYHSIGEVSGCQATVTIQAGEGSTEVGALIGGEDYPRALFWEKSAM
ncbi:MAG: hypothetical protein JW993_17090 [Sedimentisphaerales bacterium]|nr:hypothetical protein [Sedimentisphaerales bacterium]